jgi:hypothetical protein
MRIFVALLFIFGSVMGHAQLQDSEVESTSTQYISGSGHASSFCQGGPMSYFCMDQVKDSSRRDAVRDATWTCQSRQGSADTFSATCNDFCTPFSIPEGQNQYVSCQSNCTIRCEITNHANEITE